MADRRKVLTDAGSGVAVAGGVGAMGAGTAIRRRGTATLNRSQDTYNRTFKRYSRDFDKPSSARDSQLRLRKLISADQRAAGARRAISFGSKTRKVGALATAVGLGGLGANALYHHVKKSEDSMKTPVELAKSDALWSRETVEKREQWSANKRTAVFGGAGAASTAKKGKGLKVYANAEGRGVVGGLKGTAVGGAGGGSGGAALGAGIGVLTRRPGAVKSGAAIGGGSGGFLGAATGQQVGFMRGRNTSVNNSRKKGYLKAGF